MKRLILILSLALPMLLPAQTGTLYATIQDEDGPLGFAQVLLLQKGKVVFAQATDENGEAWLHGIDEGIYDVQIKFLLIDSIIKDVEIIAGDTTILTNDPLVFANSDITTQHLTLHTKSNMLSSSGTRTPNLLRAITPYTPPKFTPPVYNKWPTPSGQTILREDIRRMLRY